MNTIEVKTALGTLIAEVINNDNNPGIKIRLNNNIVAIVEQDENKIQTVAYNDCDDEFVEKTVYSSELSEEQESALEIFYENGHFVPAMDKMSEAEPYKFLWDNFDLLKSFYTDEEFAQLYVYTLVECDEGEAWIVNGQKFVNRIGYFISKTEVEIPEEGIRYW